MSLYVYMSEFFQNLQKCLEGKIEKVTDIVTNKKNDILTKIQDTAIFKNGFSVLFWLIKQNEHLKAKSKQIYNSNALVKKTVDVSIYAFYYVSACLCNNRIEPFKTNRISSSVLMKKNPTMFMGEEYFYTELYDFMKEPIIENCSTGFIDSCYTLNSMVSNTANIDEGMVTMKVGEQYINYIYPKKTDDNITLEFPLIPCSYNFLSIKYTHPTMDDDAIYIDLDKQYYYCKNEILSPLFIKRCLEHQASNYYFDMNYKLEIIDNNVETVILTSNQYILLEESKYTLMNILPLKNRGKRV